MMESFRGCGLRQVTALGASIDDEVGEHTTHVVAKPDTSVQEAKQKLGQCHGRCSAMPLFGMVNVPLSSPHGALV
jgi:hypothetical protein